MVDDILANAIAEHFPGHRAAHRLEHRGCQHRRRGHLVARGFEITAVILEDGLIGIGKGIQQIGRRRAGVTAKITDAAFQQRLEHDQRAIAIQGLALSALELGDFIGGK